MAHLISLHFWVALNGPYPWESQDPTHTHTPTPTAWCSFTSRIAGRSQKLWASEPHQRLARVNPHPNSWDGVSKLPLQGRWGQEHPEMRQIKWHDTNLRKSLLFAPNFQHSSHRFWTHHCSWQNLEVVWEPAEKDLKYVPLVTTRFLTVRLLYSLRWGKELPAPPHLSKWLSGMEDFWCFLTPAETSFPLPSHKRSYCGTPL